MGQIGELLGFGLQARAELERGARTVVELLREGMDGVDRAVRRPGFKERLGLKGFGCCGPTWGLGPTTISVRDEEEEEEEDGDALGPEIEVVHPDHNPIQNGSTPPCVVQSPATSGMNLAAALAAERQLRAVLDSDNGGSGIRSPSPSPTRHERSPTNHVTTGRSAPATPSRVSLMRLLEETDGYDLEMVKEEGERCDSMCCVCMGRKKGAAFIPCGHTFCRVCSRGMWLNRGSCPLCNRSILEILDIY